MPTCEHAHWRTLSTIVPAALAERVREIARERGTTVSRLIREQLAEVVYEGSKQSSARHPRGSEHS